MATKVHMEALSPTMEEGQLVKWLKSEGDNIASGDVLAEIETDKATMELVARGAGVLRKLFLDEGGTAPVGAVIGVIAEADEDISEIEGEAGGAAAPAKEAPEEAEAEEEEEEAPAEAAVEEEEEAPAEEAVEEEEEAPAKEAAQAQAPARTAAPAAGKAPVREEAAKPAAAPKRAGPPEAPAGDGGRVKASPLARRLAAEQGIELGAVEGSGPGGRIVKRDIEAAIEEGVRAPAPAAPAPAWGPPSEMPEVEEVPVSQMRKAIAKRLVTSIGPVPTFYLTTEVDMGRMMELRKRINASLEQSGEKVSVNDLLIKAVAAALRRHPDVNASWKETVIERYGRVHIGVAVAIEDGLITPVVRDADRKSVVEVSREVKELAGRARDKRLQPDEYTGATFSISNLGMFGIDEFTAIINPPEAGILAVGRAEEKPVVVDGEVIVRPRMRMTMSCDHRVVDGATGARFLQTLSGFVEEPGLMGM